MPKHAKTSWKITTFGTLLAISGKGAESIANEERIILVKLLAKNIYFSQSY